MAKSTALVHSVDPNFGLPKEMVDRLRAKKAERNEEEILDVLEEIEQLYKRIAILKEKVQSLSGFDYFRGSDDKESVQDGEGEVAQNSQEK